MKFENVGIDGAVVFTPSVFKDGRGKFISPLQDASLKDALGNDLFPVKQVSMSTSKRGVIRGIHFTASPGSMAKYVFCSYGRALDYLVDLRIESPTFRQVSRTELSGSNGCSLLIPPGVGHLFLALEDDTVMTYLMSAEYDAKNEKAISPFDKELDVQIPTLSCDYILSDRDSRAESFGHMMEKGLLPSYKECCP